MYLKYLVFSILFFSNINIVKSQSKSKSAPSNNKSAPKNNNFKYGGFVVYEKNGHGLIVSLIEYERKNWRESNELCNNYVSDGYDDWRLPTIDELNLIYDKVITKYGMFNFEDESMKRMGVFHDWYWSANENSEFGALQIKFGGGGYTESIMGNKASNGPNVRPVRSF